MKKIYLTLLVSLISVLGYAQTNPNRVIIWEKNASEPTSIMVEALDRIEFQQVEGQVIAEMEVGDFNETDNFLPIAVTRSGACQGFKLTTVPTTLAKVASDDYFRRSMDADQSLTIYEQDFVNGELRNDEWAPNTEYTIVTLAYDKYKTPCSVSRAEFKTPKAQIVGNPTVEISEVSNEGYQFTIHFEPNSDVTRYYTVAMEPEAFEEQFAQYAPNFGWKSEGDMIKQFSMRETTPPFQPGFGKAADCLWTDMEQNTLYRVYVQPVDANGNYADIQTFDITTKLLGGDGEATVEIQKGKFALVDAFDGEGNPIKVPTQYFNWIPNDQTSIFRFAVYEKAGYESMKEGTLKHMMEDECPADIAEDCKAYYDDFYQNLTDKGEYIAVGVARNAKGEWGPVSELPFIFGETEPASVPAMKAVKPVKESGFVFGKGFVGNAAAVKGLSLSGN